MEDHQPGWWLRRYLEQRYGLDAVRKQKSIGRQGGKTELTTAILQPMETGQFAGPEFEFESLEDIR